jgi:hypothetical protein
MHTMKAPVLKLITLASQFLVIGFMNHSCLISVYYLLVFYGFFYCTEWNLLLVNFLHIYKLSEFT